jgi:hypothetical protein
MGDGPRQARGKLPPGVQRAFWFWIALAYVGLIPLGLSLYFGVKGDNMPTAVTGFITGAYFVALWVWRGRNGLSRADLRRYRRQ